MEINIKSNKILLIGLLSIGIMFFITNDFIFIVFFPVYFEIDLGIIYKFKLLVLHIIMMVSLVTLNIQKNRLTKIQE